MVFTVKPGDRPSTLRDLPRRGVVLRNTVRTTSSNATSSEPPAQLPAYIEQAMLEILNQPIPEASAYEDAKRRERELRTLFLALDASQANDLIRRFDASDDPLAQAFRRFIRRRR
jgi:hypothetical protein